MSILRKKCRGISLIEVLISIGVVSIGLLGVVSLIPVASQQAELGTRNDRKANLGRRSFRELNVRGFQNAGTATDQNWIGYKWYSSRQKKKRVFNMVRSSFQPQPFCIDPRYVAEQQDTSGDYLFAKRGNAVRFEFGKAPLATAVGGPIGVSGGSNATGLSGMPVISLASSDASSSTFMTEEQAEETFVFQDDLEFVLPTSNAELPIQSFLTTDPDGAGPTPPQNVKRYAKGQFSWFVTAFPESDDWWVVSTVICYQRNNLDYPDALGIMGECEHKTPLTNGTTSGFYTSGVSGGDVRIKWEPGSKDLPREPRSGDWLLFGKTDNNGTPTSTTDDFQEYEWYRVVFSAEPERLQNELFQDLTLEGRDWDTTSNRFKNNQTNATWVPEVVAVYSKQVRITNQ